MIDIWSGYVPEMDLKRPAEISLIAQTKAGSNLATETLLQAYSPVIKKYYSKVPWRLKDEAQSALLEGFLNAVHAFDEEIHDGLHVIIKTYLSRALETLNVVPGFHIPSRTLSRFWSIWRVCEADVYEGMRVCEDYSMSKSTFLAVHTALNHTSSLDAVLATGQDDFASLSVSIVEPLDEDSRQLARLIFKACSDENDLSFEESEVLMHSYGFHSYGVPKTDDHVGSDLGISRTKTQRVRTCALIKGRHRLGINN